MLLTLEVWKTQWFAFRLLLTSWAKMCSPACRNIYNYNHAAHQYTAKDGEPNHVPTDRPDRTLQPNDGRALECASRHLPHLRSAV